MAIILHTVFHFVNAIHLYMYKYRGDVEIKHYNIVKNDCAAFKTNIFCVSKPTFNSVPHNHVGS